MQPKLPVLLWDIKAASEEIQDFTPGKSLREYQPDKLLRGDGERCFTIIGEAVVRPRTHYPVEYRKLAYGPEIVGFRNHLTHANDRVDDEEMWRTVETAHPGLMLEVAASLEVRKA